MLSRLDQYLLRYRDNMSRHPTTLRIFRYLSLATPLCVVTMVATPARAMTNARTYYRAKHAAARLAQQTHSVAMGTFKDGPRHTWHAMKEKPIDFGIKLVVVGVVGGVAKKLGIDPAPIAIAASFGSLGVQFWKTLPDVRLETGHARLRSIGANFVWPTVLGVSTTVGGEMAGGHGPHTKQAATLADAVRAGLQTIIIASDVPAVLQTAFRSKPTSTTTPEK